MMIYIVMNAQTILTERTKFYVLKQLLLDKISNEEERIATSDYIEELISERIAYDVFKFIKDKLQSQNVDYDRFVKEVLVVTQVSNDDLGDFSTDLVDFMDKYKVKCNEEETTKILVDSYAELSEILLTQFTNQYPDEKHDVLEVLKNVNELSSEITNTLEVELNIQ